MDDDAVHVLEQPWAPHHLLASDVDLPHLEESFAQLADVAQCRAMVAPLVLGAPIRDLHPSLATFTRSAIARPASDGSLASATRRLMRDFPTTVALNFEQFRDGGDAQRDGTNGEMSASRAIDVLAALEPSDATMHALTCLADNAVLPVDAELEFGLSAGTEAYGFGELAGGTHRPSSTGPSAASMLPSNRGLETLKREGGQEAANRAQQIAATVEEEFKKAPPVAARRSGDAVPDATATAEANDKKDEKAESDDDGGDFIFRRGDTGGTEVVAFTRKPKGKKGKPAAAEKPSAAKEEDAPATGAPQEGQPEAVPPEAEVQPAPAAASVPPSGRQTPFVDADVALPEGLVCSDAVREALLSVPAAVRNAALIALL